jgi:hypothetical protein
MFNSYNPYNNPMDRIDNQIRELENLKKGYQNLPQQPTNIFNVGNNTPQINFEARMLEENEKPEEILVQRKTAFIDLKKGLLSIKEINGDIKEFKIELPKTPEQLKIEELERKVKEYEYELSAINSNSSTDEENGKSDKCDEPEPKKDTKRVQK